MKLIGTPSSPFVRKVRIVIAEKKLDYQFESVDLWSADSPVQRHNPLGKVPCLIMDEDAVLYDSRVIVEYLDTLSPVSRLLPASTRERVSVKSWEALADGLLDACVSIRQELTQRPEAQRSEAFIARQQGKVEAALQAIADGVGERAFCVGNSYTLADIAVGCVLGYLDFRFPDIAWRSRHANLVKFYERLAQRQSFIDTVPAG